MRPLALVAALFALLGLTCSSKSSSDTDGISESGATAWFEPDVNCESDSTEFSAEAYGAFTGISVEVYSGETLIETVALVDRGDGDWFASSDTRDTIETCLDGSSSYFLFTGTLASGGTIEEGI